MFKILVVDDDAGLRLSIKSAFSISSKFEVMEAYDGINAMEKIKNSGVKFDVVIFGRRYAKIEWSRDFETNQRV